MKEENVYIHWLHSIEGVGQKNLKKLMTAFQCGKNIFDASERQLKKVEGINQRIIHNILENKSQEQLQRIRDRISQLGIISKYMGDEGYPESLKNIYDPPFILHMRGNLFEQDIRAVAIVGARKASAYGKWAAYKLAGELAQRGIVVVSGMAYGIDTAAHKGALDAGGRTIAVLGCGVDICYPKTNYQLMEEIAAKGAVISEYALGTEPISGNFPARNRIISGLSKGVVVVEAGLKSGSLITAEMALEQGREVFAVPGNINNTMSAGSNKLIQEGAKLVASVEDILCELDIVPETITEKVAINLSETEGKVYEKILERQPVHFEALSSMLGMDVHKISSIITILQIKGLIEQLPGKILIIK
ncbi:DNA-processing protein DprA [Geosporobacter ferrireducens]|uniref:DNA protecting protein DprA n=1 Tax=Geosporobacter ferrireducens TaxID=1424294 RepID=A0A1D8GBL5_9FIRM|nr:DNA-processing protein DprA [Geosporobacter ferrireducens]AOT68292.1 DNA protecting protein DprA [Geosporobacter ferrireducens]